MPQRRIETYADAMKQANREAKSTVVALFAIIAVWLVCGFGLSGLDIWVFHTPLWVIGGCVAPWIAAIIAAVVLGYKVFADFDLDSVAADAHPGDARAAGVQHRMPSTAAMPQSRSRAADEGIGGRHE